MSNFVQDVRYAVRVLKRQPGFALFVILTLGIGVGANTAVFSVVNGVLLKPLPYPESDRLVSVIGRFDPESGFNFPEFPLSEPEFLDYRTESKALEDVAAYARRSINVGGAGAEPERVVSAAASANLFTVLRVNPIIGRGFAPGDDTRDAPATAVLSYGYWRSRFGGDPGVLGRAVPMNGVATTIIGVMPDGFAYPGTTTRIWVPLRIDPGNPGGRKSHSIRAIGRVAPTASVESARAEIRTLMEGWKVRFPDTHTGHYLFIRPLLDTVAGAVRPALLLLLGATAFVLLIVCANVANVVMARGEVRLREMAIRGALGAQRARLVRLSLVESAVLGVAGGALGVALAYAGVRALLAIDPTSIPRASEVTIDGRMLLFAASVSLMSVVLFGLIPALRGAATDLQSTLREGSLSTSGSTTRLWVRRSLVAVEVALAVVLVVGAGLMIRSINRLFTVDPGFRAEGLAMTAVSLPSSDYREPERVLDFYTRLLERVRSLPGVTAAAATSGVPLWSDTGVWDFDIDGRPAPAAGEMAWNAGVTIVTPGFFETLGMRLVRGRFFSEADGPGAMSVTAINETMAARFFPGEDPIGKRIRVKGNTNARRLDDDRRDRRGHSRPAPRGGAPSALLPAEHPDAGHGERSVARAGDRHPRGGRAGCGDVGRAGCRAISRPVAPRLRRADARHDRRHVARAAAVPGDAAEPLRPGRAHARRVRHLWRAGLHRLPAHAGTRHPPRARRPAVTADARRAGPGPATRGRGTRRRVGRFRLDHEAAAIAAVRRLSNRCHHVHDGDRWRDPGRDCLVPAARQTCVEHQPDRGPASRMKRVVHRGRA